MILQERYYVKRITINFKIQDIAMFNWFRSRRRKKLMQVPFPALWEEIIKRNVVHYSMLDESEQTHLKHLIQVFISEKYWEGAGGLELDDEIKVTISAQACLLLLGLPHNYYKNVMSIIVYPSTVVPPKRKRGFFENSMTVENENQPILGQAFMQGPVIIIWDAALHGGRHPELGHNVIYHEFAHKLDMLDGAADGTPPLHERADYRDWINVCTREFTRLRKDAGRGRKSFMDSYGATNEAEFFAVATEQFFDRPERMIKETPELYDVLKEYYNQDPVKRKNY